MSSRALQILVVEDNIDSATTTGWLLESMGYPNYTLAQDGPTALEIARRMQPDVVMLDIGLPGMNGYEVCRELRRNPVFADTLIIAQTGWGQDRYREMAYFAGFDHHLTKPLRPVDLEALLSKVVPRSEAPPPGKPHAAETTRSTEAHSRKP
ncbi:MAG: response regulator [Pseudomonadota bacterium]|nr:response regulator [Pseudomonadota bacterium]